MNNLRRRSFEKNITLVDTYVIPTSVNISNVYLNKSYVENIEVPEKYTKSSSTTLISHYANPIVITFKVVEKYSDGTLKDTGISGTYSDKSYIIPSALIWKYNTGEGFVGGNDGYYYQRTVTIQGVQYPFYLGFSNYPYPCNIMYSDFSKQNNGYTINYSSLLYATDKNHSNYIYSQNLAQFTVTITDKDSHKASISAQLL